MFGRKYKQFEEEYYIYMGELAVSMKNINNRKTISVIDDILKSGLTLFLPFNFISEKL